MSRYFKKISLVLAVVLLIQISLLEWLRLSPPIKAAASGPVIVNKSPADDSQNVGTSTKLSFTVDESITKGNGSAAIIIYEYLTNSVFESFVVASSGAVTIDSTGRNVTIQPSKSFQANTEYYVIIDPGAFANVSNGANFSGIANNNQWNFKTGSVSLSSVTSVAVPSNGVYGAGGSLDFTMNMSESVTVTGTPSIALIIGSTTVHANYASGSGTNALVFRYTIQAGNEDSDGVTIGALSLNGGSIKDSDGNHAILTLHSVGSTAGVLVDAVPPSISSVVVPSAGTYTIGDSLNFIVNMSKKITITGDGTPQLEINIGGMKRIASLNAGTMPDTNVLQFGYTVQAGDNDNDGIAITVLSLNGGSMKDTTGNDADLTLHNVGSTAEVLIDTMPTLNTSASLNSLNLNGVRLDQTVSGSVYDYTASVPNSLSNFTVTATVSDPIYGTVTASVYNSANSLVAGPISLASGATSIALPLEVGRNRMELFVIAQDGTSTKYTVMITRAAQDNGSNGSGNGGNNSSDNDNNGSNVGGGSTVILPVISTNGKLTLPVGQAGEVRLDKGLVISIPANATNKELKLTIEKLFHTQSLLDNHEIPASSIYEVLKNFPENFSKPVTLTFVFDSAQLKSDQTVAVFYYDEVKKDWVKINGGKINGDRISVDIDHFAKFAVLVVDQATGVPVIDPSTEPTTGAQLSDISGHWAKANIKQAVSTGIVKGYTDGTFKPNAKVTRAEFVVMLMNALKPTGKSVEMRFTDSIPAWAQKSIAQALEAKIIQGYEDGTFRPAENITRSELAVMIDRVVGRDVITATSTGFADDREVPSWAKEAVAAVKELGIVSGRNGNLFAPNETATRAEAVTIIMNLLHR